MHRSVLFRLEENRAPVKSSCHGVGTHLLNHQKFNYIGIDVSAHGFGCVVDFELKKNDAIILTFKNASIAFYVSWVETHLGIERKYRVGLLAADHTVDVAKVIEN